MRFSPAIICLLFLMNGCGSGRQLQSPSTGFLEIREFSSQEIIPGTLELAAGSLLNLESQIVWECTLKNISNRVSTFEIRIRFFDVSFKTEYEKFPVVRTVRMGPGVEIDMNGRVDFRGLPQAGKIQRLGIEANARN